MKEWLLKEEKNKVGRPKLAGTSVVRKAEILIAFSLCICFVLAFCFICELEGTDPKKRAYTLTIGKLTGNIKNPNGFIIKDYYDKDYNYIMDIKIPESIKNYSGSYKYTTYYLSNNGWKEKETKPFDKDIKIKLESKKNKNVTWKVKLQIVNASVIEKSYAPASWHFVDSKKPEDKYTYKTFTVKGYYSPVTINEIKEKKNGKIYVETSREDPRCFTLNLRDRKYDIVVKYLDENGKEVLLSKENDITGIKNYRVPNLNRSTKVTFKITGSNLKDKKLSNWKYVDNKYITNSYVLKPERAY